MASTSFHRGLTVCDVAPAPCGWAWLAFVAVDRDHPFHGRRFGELPASCLPLSHVNHVTGLQEHDKRWWFVVDVVASPDKDAALRKLCVASDELTQMAS